MPDGSTGTEKHNYDRYSNTHDPPGDPPPGSDEWLAIQVRAIRKQIEEIREEIGQTRSLREKDRDDQLLTYADVAERLQVSERHVQTLAHSGELTPIRLGRAVRFDPDAVDAFVRRKAEASGHE